MNAFSQPLGWMLIFYIPPAVVLLWLYRTKRAHDVHARQPFTEQPLRLAGESAREKADELFDSAAGDMLTILVACPVMGLVFALLPGPNRLTTCIVVFIVSSIASLFIARRLRKNLLESWDYRLGAKGEQVVGRELDRLAAQGYEVFHDLPFAGWNIDHVVVGPRGVFAVETKAWRKPPKKSDLDAEVLFDGESLAFPGRPPDRQPLEQATRNARDLAKWIADAAAEKVIVVPVVALPGWKLTIRRYGEVAVYSATNMSESMPKRGKSPLTPEQIQRISFQLAKRCSVGPANDAATNSVRA